MKISPTFRISFGLVLLTLSIIMMADLIGLAPDNSKAALDDRKNVSEALAIEFSLAAQHDQFELIKDTLQAIVERNDDILSAGLRNSKGALIAQGGEHDQYWNYSEDKQSTPTHVIVPIFQGEEHWGAVEIHFTDLIKKSLFGLSLSPLTKLLIFVSLAGFAGYTFLMHRTLRYLSPSSIVPGRVQFALDALRSGVALIDQTGKIILANTALIEAHNTSADRLFGKRLNVIEWRDITTNRKITKFPWTDTLVNSKAVIGAKIQVSDPGKPKQIYVVNCTPILDADNKSRGALVSFEDITSIQWANEKLMKTLDDLEHSRSKIEKQNKKLTVLATRDSMTGCLNRRSFFEDFDEIFASAASREKPISCIMTDIDHFKKINDSHGHLFGDQVIKFVAEILQSESRSVDSVCRYGGEEFCILMPDLSLDEAANIAERLRFSIEKLANQRLDEKVRVTSSFGITSSKLGATNPMELVNQADQALYQAKERGRNRVFSWSEELEADSRKTGSDDPAEDPRDQRETTSDTISEHSITGTGSSSFELNLEELQIRVQDLEGVIEKQSRELLLKNAYDSLTGLPNRMLFQDRINQAIAHAKRTSQMAAVISLDIEAFKRIHDTLGNNVADELVRKVSKHLTEILRDTDTIALLSQNNSRTAISRINADEFGILVTDLDSIEPIVWIIKRIFSALEHRAEIDKHEIFLNSCIGISLYPEDGNSSEELINNAATARYYASKQAGDHRHQFFSSELNTASTYQMKIEGDLHRAIENKELILHYQPKLNISTGKIIGVEGLVRWQHPTEGLVSPMDFIPAAERSGLINDLGDLVMRMACKQASEWCKSNITDFCVSVNLSATQLRQDDLCKKILGIIEDAGIQPHNIELEITESTAMSSIEDAVQSAMELQSAGVRISLDDFGTGFSSLSYLKVFPANTLKIDRSFISDLSHDSENLSIVAAIIAMSHKLGLNVLAEGVETVEQLKLLRKLNCDEIQGYLFSMPMPAEELQHLLGVSENHLERIEQTEQKEREDVAAAS